MSSSATATATAVDGGFRKCNSPILYLFGGLTLMLGLIAVTLAVLTCSYRKSSASSGPSRGPEDRTGASNDNDEPSKIEVENNVPKIAVIMPGHENPTFLAKLASSSTTSHNGCQQV
ncbi:protein GLUTAMINE DUMPER 2-like [Rhodamnia argentea]|uniref:Protein GLUTAMINE DUMPER 2-like n=1 Tax=Rhodamnia argentea TaxID=178133 RepID=A0ABM3HY69_9MYRT|nr:protein GLUTAMINE DUMPER 2-like [Rhodamnia argentea]